MTMNQAKGLVTVSAGTLLAVLALSCSDPGGSKANPERAAPIPGVTTPLHEAAKSGDIETLEASIPGVQIDARDEEGATALIWASANGHADAVRLLISKGSDVNARLANGLSPLHFASQYGHKDVCQLLLKAGAELEATSTGGLRSTPLYSALIYDQMEVASFLIERGADVNVIGDSPTVPNTPLAIAAWEEDAELIQLLLKHGARDPWLSAVPGFDPHHFSPVTPGVYEDGEIRVGNLPFFLARHSVTRPWKEPERSRRSTSGNDFVRWAGDSKHEPGQLLVVLEMTDSGGNETLVRVVPPVFYGTAGVAYPQNVTAIVPGGPFISLHANDEDAIVRRHNGSVLGIQPGRDLVLLHVEENEPLTVMRQDGNSVEIDCVLRGALEGVVSYDVR